MDKIAKALARLSPKEQNRVAMILRQLAAGRTTDLDVKKLKGREDIFRVRLGEIRIIYQIKPDKTIFILTIERRSDTTYNF